MSRGSETGSRLGPEQLSGVAILIFTAFTLVVVAIPQQPLQVIFVTQAEFETSEYV